MKIIIPTLSLALLPSIAFAFPGDLTGFVCLLLDLIKVLVPILVGLAFLLFFWGVTKFILSAGDSKAISEGKNFMAYGVVGIFVLVSFWGIIQFMSDQFNFTGNVKDKSFLPGGNSASSCDLREVV